MREIPHGKKTLAWISHKRPTDIKCPKSMSDAHRKDKKHHKIPKVENQCTICAWPKTRRCESGPVIADPNPKRNAPGVCDDGKVVVIG